MNSQRICAYITAYEDHVALYRCIEAIKKQSYPIDKILIVDNSKTSIVTSPYNVDEHVNVIHHPENIGVSGGLAVAIQWSIERNYDFLWTFDQDSIPEPDCLEALLQQYHQITEENISAGIIAPLAIDINIQIELPGHIFKNYRFIPSPEHQKSVYECDVVITSGSLISISSAKKSALPNQDLFIDGVDWDYCLSLKKTGFRIFLTRQAIIQHRFSDLSLATFPITGKQIMINRYSPLRYYYISRNHTYIILSLCNLQNKPLAAINRLYRTLRVIAKIWFYENDQRFLKTWACLLGIFDGFLGRLGKRW